MADQDSQTPRLCERKKSLNGSIAKRNDFSILLRCFLMQYNVTNRLASSAHAYGDKVQFAALASVSSARCKVVDHTLADRYLGSASSSVDTCVHFRNQHNALRRSMCTSPHRLSRRTHEKEQSLQFYCNLQQKPIEKSDFRYISITRRAPTVIPTVTL